MLFDAVIVGSGPGGSTLAYGLAKRGFKVVVLEHGEFLRSADNRLDPVSMGEFKGKRWVGGLSKFYGAALYRMREIDFRATAMESGESPAWPITYDELEPYYCEAESLYGVRGSSHGDPTDPARSADWPHSPIKHQGPILELVERLESRAKIPVAAIPRGIDYGPDGTCVLCQCCDGYYCPRDARFDGETAALRPAVATGNVEVWTNSECLRVNTSPNGKKVTGVQVRRDGVELTIDAPIVSVSAGTTDTPILLWRSRNSHHPDGLANASGALGRYLAGHTQGWLFLLSKGIQAQPFHQKTFSINAFYESSPGWPYPTGVIQAVGFLEVEKLFPPPLGWLVGGLFRNSLQVFFMSEGLPSPRSGFRLTDSGPRKWVSPCQNVKTFRQLRNLGVDAFRSAGYRVFAPNLFPSKVWHPVGTARFGSDPSASITNSNCEAHDVEGLYVVDSSTLPTAGAVNTTLTVIALALRTAEAISSRQ
jgi:choline dehydrogenase-like flavoprotein